MQGFPFVCCTDRKWLIFSAKPSPPQTQHGERARASFPGGQQLLHRHLPPWESKTRIALSLTVHWHSYQCERDVRSYEMGTGIHAPQCRQWCNGASGCELCMNRKWLKNAVFQEEKTQPPGSLRSCTIILNELN